MTRLGLDTQESKALVSVIVADVYAFIYPDVCCRPSVTMRTVIFMDCLDQFGHLFTIDIPVRRLAILPFIVASTVDSHHSADVFDGIVARQQRDYFELFSFKRTYSGTPASFI